MKAAAILMCLFLAGCESARGLQALGYCAFYQNNPNKRCN